MRQKQRFAPRGPGRRLRLAAPWGAALATVAMIAACDHPSVNDAAPSSNTGVSAAAPSGSSQERRDSIAKHVGYGTVMADVARRFELLGRAVRGTRWELASYELGEIAETFERDLPEAAPPKEGHPEVLPDLASGFVKTAIPDLERALKTHDASAADAAFAHTAATCNGCHAASGHAFIEVPTQAGGAVPVTDRQADVTAAEAGAPRSPRPTPPRAQAW